MRAIKAASTTVLVLCAAVLGPVVVMAESGGKDSRPELLLALLLAIGVVGGGVRVQERHAAAVATLTIAAAVLGAAPVGLSFVFADGKQWPLVIGIPWLLALSTAVGAALLSRRAANAPPQAARAGS